MPPTYRLSSFEQLTTAELYAVLALRAEVFVVEQACAYQDLDGLDQAAIHLTQYVGDALTGYTRLLAPGTDFEHACAIGRVVTAPTHRRRGYGRPLMRASIAECHRRWPGSDIDIHAQTYLLSFYRGFGFRPYGEEFLEDGLPHHFMRLAAPLSPYGKTKPDGSGPTAKLSSATKPGE